MTTWADIACKLDGITHVRHAALTFNGTWGAGLVQYPSLVAGALPDLVEEIPVPYPASFGPLGGDASSMSYSQSVQWAFNWVSQWLAANPLRTFCLIGYSQGAEAAARVAMALMGGSLAHYLPNFIGGITFGPPCRGAGFHAPTIADPGGRGIANVNMASLPAIGGRVVWADYVHSKANGDAGDDMYGVVPMGAVGQVMTDVYNIATQVQLNNIGLLTTNVIDGLTYAVKDAVSAPLAAIEAAGDGIAFLAAPGGPTAPHISYGGEIDGYSNLLPAATTFLGEIADLTPARTAA
ncbi:PE-PPE domain-containing protein [Mycobacteroides abscessus]|uniref:PE-PPE domain-containing protein n=1 Tax=Mycobacteroides abscessus TaxID=36809 RepID=UPI0016023C3B|nr:PE-PPE domain-containing protein [Mycobacteroides abscessus]